MKNHSFDQPIDIETCTVLSSPGSFNRRKAKSSIHHLKLFHKKSALANRLLNDNVTPEKPENAVVFDDNLSSRLNQSKNNDIQNMYR